MVPQSAGSNRPHRLLDSECGGTLLFENISDRLLVTLTQYARRLESS